MDQSRQLVAIEQRYNAKNSIVLRAQGNFEQVLRLPEPSNINEALEAPKINFLKNAWGESNISKVLTVLSRDAAKVLGFKIEGNERVLGLMVKDFIEMKPYFSLEDFILFFKMIRQRKLGSKTYGKENWEFFYNCLDQYDSERDQEIEHLNKELSKPIENLPLPADIIDKLAAAFPMTNENDREKEIDYIKVREEYLQKRRQQTKSENHE